MAADDDEGDETAEQLAESLSAVMARLRKEKGWSLEDLADEAGLHRTYIGLVERGERHLSVAAAYKVAVALGLPLSTVVEMAEAELAGEEVVAAEPMCSSAPKFSVTTASTEDSGVNPDESRIPMVRACASIVRAFVSADHPTERSRSSLFSSMAWPFCCWDP